MTTKTKAKSIMLSEKDRATAIAQVTEACERLARRLRGQKMTLTMLKMSPTDRVSIAAELLDALGVTVDDLRRASPRKVPRLDSDLTPGLIRH